MKHCKAILLYALVAIASPALSLSAAVPLGTAFTYQGRLEQNGQPASNWVYSMRFALFDASSGGNFLGTNLLAVPVTNGLFTTNLDYGANAFTGDARWLEIGVSPDRVSPAPAYTLLAPRTRIAPTPNTLFALKAGTVVAGSIQASNLAAGTPGSGQVLGFNGTSLVWQGAGGGGTGPWLVNGSNAYYNGGNVGIGTMTPLAPLDVLGNWTGEQGGLNLFGNRPTIRFTGDAANNGSQSWILHLSGNGPGNLEFYRRTGPGSWANHLTLHANGSLGLGTPAPSSSYKLDVLGGQRIRGDLEINSGGSLLFGAAPSEEELGVFAMRSWAPPLVQAPTRFIVNRAGNVGIGTAAPTEKLHVTGGSLLVQGPLGQQAYVGADHTPNDIELGSRNPAVTAVHLWNGGYGGFMDLVARDVAARDVSCRVLTIYGGADLAEPFPMKEETIEKGAVVVIDNEHPGQLKRSTQAYDKRVAGIVSGANGINPGIALKQEGALDRGENVALTGRVYVQADASFGAIEPGDLLTTSDTPGHAMKVTDHGKAQGAILGKAMGGLKEGKGLVLVLVTLQ